MNGAQSLLATLTRNGIDVCFANPGTSEMHFVAALDQVGGMRCVLGLFEGVVTGAADGYARMAGRPASTLLHLGPGLANGLSNLHNAMRAQSPVVNIIGDHATYHRHYDAPLTSDIEGTARPFSHWVRTSPNADSVAADAAAAVAAARTAPGRIASLILPADAAWTPTTAPSAEAVVPAAPPVAAPVIDAAASILRSGETTVLLLGPKAAAGAPPERRLSWPGRSPR
jgi:acetolactate synthase-1/2/3 large subunit